MGCPRDADHQKPTGGSVTPNQARDKATGSPGCGSETQYLQRQIHILQTREAKNVWQKVPS